MFSPLKSARRFVSRWRNQLCIVLGLGILVTTATAAEAPTEIKRRLNNGARIRELHPWMQPKVGAVLADLEAHGERPLIHADVWRTAARQAQLKGKGVSKVGFSFHMVTDYNGKTKKFVPASFAADVIDNGKGYNVGNYFWLMLASSAESHGLTTGVYWGLRETDRAKIRQLIQSKQWKTKYNRGWDPSHTEPPPWVLTLKDAKNGKRPPVPR
jgi:hypothetical protein